MNMKLLRIGDVARLFHLSVSSLRHYESLGLLTPEFVDPETGYRYYSVRQFEALNTIRYLRALDMPLDEIADFLGNRDVCRIEQKLRDQKAEVVRRKEELARIERKIDNRLRMLADAQSSELDTVRVVEAPASRMVVMQDSLKIDSFFDMEAPIRRLEASQSGTSGATEAIVFLGKVGVGISPDNLNAGRFGQYDSIFIVLDDEDSFSGETVTFPASTCVSVRFRGSHSDSPAQYRKLMDYLAAHRLVPSGFSREITMIDYGITNDTDKFVTEIMIPVGNPAQAADT